MRNFFGQSCRDNQNTHFNFNDFFFCRKSCRCNVEKYGSDRQATDGSVIRHVCTECRVNKARETHSEYTILIDFL